MSSNQLRHKDVVQLLRKTGAHFSRNKLEEAGTELCRWDTQKACLQTIVHIYCRQFTAIHSDPSCIADTGTTSRPAVTQTVGMSPGSIASDLFCITGVGRYTTHSVAPVSYLPETLNRFCQDGSDLQFQKHTCPALRYNKNDRLLLW